MIDARTLRRLPFGSVVRINTVVTEDVGISDVVHHPAVEYFIRSGEFGAHDFVSAETTSEADAEHLVGKPGLAVVWSAPQLTPDHLKEIHGL